MIVRNSTLPSSSNSTENIRTDYLSKSVAVKRYRQENCGSAYFKVAGQLLSLAGQGVSVIIVIFGGDRKYARYYRKQVDLVNELCPQLTVTFIEEY